MYVHTYIQVLRSCHVKNQLPVYVYCVVLEHVPTVQPALSNQFNLEGHTKSVLLISATYFQYWLTCNLMNLKNLRRYHQLFMILNVHMQNLIKHENLFTNEKKIQQKQMH